MSSAETIPHPIFKRSMLPHLGEGTGGEKQIGVNTPNRVLWQSTREDGADKLPPREIKDGRETIRAEQIRVAAMEVLEWVWERAALRPDLAPVLQEELLFLLEFTLGEVIEAEAEKYGSLKNSLEVVDAFFILIEVAKLTPGFNLDRSLSMANGHGGSPMIYTRIQTGLQVAINQLDEADPRLVDTIEQVLSDLFSLMQHYPGGFDLVGLTDMVTAKNHLNRPARYFNGHEQGKTLLPEELALRKKHSNRCLRLIRKHTAVINQLQLMPEEEHPILGYAQTKWWLIEMFSSLILDFRNGEENYRQLKHELTTLAGREVIDPDQELVGPLHPAVLRVLATDPYELVAAQPERRYVTPIPEIEFLENVFTETDLLFEANPDITPLRMGGLETLVSFQEKDRPLWERANYRNRSFLINFMKDEAAELETALNDLWSQSKWQGEHSNSARESLYQEPVKKAKLLAMWELADLYIFGVKFAKWQGLDLRVESRDKAQIEADLLPEELLGIGDEREIGNILLDRIVQGLSQMEQGMGSSIDYRQITLGVTKLLQSVLDMSQILEDNIRVAVLAKAVRTDLKYPVDDLAKANDYDAIDDLAKANDYDAITAECRIKWGKGGGDGRFADFWMVNEAEIIRKARQRGKTILTLMEEITKMWEEYREELQSSVIL